MEYTEQLNQLLMNVPRDKFRQNANKLLNECFILKSCDDTKNCYYFILREKLKGAQQNNPIDQMSIGQYFN